MVFWEEEGGETALQLAVSLSVCVCVGRRGERGDGERILPVNEQEGRCVRACERGGADYLKLIRKGVVCLRECVT